MNALYTPTPRVLIKGDTVDDIVEQADLKRDDSGQNIKHEEEYFSSVISVSIQPYRKE